ncbi:MAG: deoxyribodipyrimidine photolyase, partial [Bacteroidetes bacterium]
KRKLRESLVYYKEHPLNKNYVGTEEPRDWMFSVTGYYRSFFAFWKKCQKEMKTW